MAAKYVDFIVTGDPAIAKATAEQALTSRKFRITWSDDWTATAERGSKVGTFLVGTFAQYFKIGVQLRALQPGETVIRVESQSSGMAGGAIGVSRTRQNFTSLRTELEATFGTAGVLRGVQEG